MYSVALVYAGNSVYVLSNNFGLLHNSVLINGLVKGPYKFCRYIPRLLAPPLKWRLNVERIDHTSYHYQEWYDVLKSMVNSLVME